MIPERVVNVKPKNIATFRAVRWMGNPSDLALLWLCQQYGWTQSTVTESPHGRGIRITARNRKSLLLREGHWIVALGTGGAFRTISDRSFHREYEETP